MIQPMRNDNRVLSWSNVLIMCDEENYNGFVYGAIFAVTVMLMLGMAAFACHHAEWCRIP